MISEIFSDIFGSVSYVIQSSSYVMLGAILAISIFGGLRMTNISAVFGWMFESTLILGVIHYLCNWLCADDRFTFGVWETQTLDSWNALMAIDLQQLMGYFALFFLLILAIHMVKRFARG